MAFLIRPRGLEPLTFGLGNQCSKDVKPCNGNGLQGMPPHNSPENTLVETNSPELQFIIDRWESLPDHVRGAVLLLVERAVSIPQSLNS